MLILIESQYTMSYTSYIYSKVRNKCNQCEYKATQQSSLTTHIQSLHEGVRNEYIYIRLLSRVLIKHKQIQYKCE